MLLILLNLVGFVKARDIQMLVPLMVMYLAWLPAVFLNCRGSFITAFFVEQTPFKKYLWFMFAVFAANVFFADTLHLIKFTVMLVELIIKIMEESNK